MTASHICHIMPNKLQDLAPFKPCLAIKIFCNDLLGKRMVHAPGSLEPGHVRYLYAEVYICCVQEAGRTQRTEEIGGSSSDLDQSFEGNVHSPRSAKGRGQATGA